MKLHPEYITERQHVKPHPTLSDVINALQKIADKGHGDTPLVVLDEDWTIFDHRNVHCIDVVPYDENKLTQEDVEKESGPANAVWKEDMEFVIIHLK